MGTPLGPKYIPHTYMDPLGFKGSYLPDQVHVLRPWRFISSRLVLWLPKQRGLGFGFFGLGFRV